jgi:tripartite ATP-independent transporter DctP family solute receptor
MFAAHTARWDEVIVWPVVVFWGRGQVTRTERILATKQPIRSAIYAALALVVGIASTIAAKARDLRAADIQVEHFATVQALQYMGRLVAEHSDGRLRMTIFPSGELGNEGQTIEQTRAGVIDISRVNAVEIAQFAPALNVLALPYLFRSNDHLHNVIDGPIGDEILASLDAYGFVGLTFYDAGARSLYTAKKLVRTLADVEGLRLRVQRSELMDEMAKALGADPVRLSYLRIPTALSTRLIDGAEGNWPAFMTGGHYKVAPFYSLTEHTRAPSVVIMSHRVWDELSPQDRAIIYEAARESAKHMREAWRRAEDEARNQASAAGVTIVNDIDRKPFEEATKPLRDELAADPKFGPLIQRIEAAQ